MATTKPMDMSKMCDTMPNCTGDKCPMPMNTPKKK